MALVVITAPTVEPLSLAELKTHARVDHTDEDALLQSKLTSARQYVERYIGRSLINTTFELIYDEFPSGGIRLPRPPLQSVTSIGYVDSAGIEQVLDTAQYTVDTASEPGRVTPGEDGWPDTMDTTNAVRIRFIAGFGATAAEVPHPLREAVMQLAAQLYAHREAALYGLSASSIPFGVGDTLNEYREWSF